MSPPAPGGESGPELPPFESPDVVFDPRSDPGGATLGVAGTEATVDLPWPALLRHRVQQRATGSSRYRWWVLCSLLAGLFALNFTFTVFVVALPHIRAEFHSNFSVLTWVSTGPLLAFGLAAPIFGRAGDLFGHRRLYLFGLAGAMVSAVLTALAPNVGMLIFARALDGVQGAATGTASMALILSFFSPEDRVKAMGWWSMVGAGGPVVGVSVGSPIIDAFGWRALFWFQLVLLVISALVVALILPSRRHAAAATGEPDATADPGSTATAQTPTPASSDAGSRWRGIDWIGSWSLSAAVTGGLLVLSIGPLAGWTSPGVVIAALVGLAALALFVHREGTYATPLIPSKYFRRRNFVLPMAARAGTTFAYFGGFFLFPLLMEETYGWSVRRAGLVSIARPLAFAISAPIAGYLTVRLGERSIAVAGSVSVVASMVLFASLGGQSNVLMIVVALGLAGLGMGVSGGATSSTQANEVDPGEFGVMSAAQQLATQVGEVAGIQVLVTIQEVQARRSGTLHHAGSLLAGFHDAFWVGGLVAVGAVVFAGFIKSLPRTRDQATAMTPAPG